MGHRAHTSFTPCECPMIRVRTRSTCTLEPSRVPTHTHPEAVVPMFSRGPGSVHDFGNTSLMLHTLPSSCRDTWKTRLAGSEISTRTYAASDQHKVERDDFDTNPIEILHEPRQIILLEGWKAGLILVSTKDVDELLMELWRGSVEVAERL